MVIAFTKTPLIVHAQQLFDPSCNPDGYYNNAYGSCRPYNFSTIIVSGSTNNSVIYYYDQYGYLDQTTSTYYNSGNILITSGGILTNNATLRTYKSPLAEPGTYSDGTLNNSGTLNNFSGLQFDYGNAYQ